MVKRELFAKVFLKGVKKGNLIGGGVKLDLGGVNLTHVLLKIISQVAINDFLRCQSCLSPL